jgi:hypothetical protein
MKILKESLDGENYIEVVLSDKEVHKLATYHIISCPVIVGRKIYSLGVRLITNREEEEDAVDEIE